MVLAVRRPRTVLGRLVARRGLVRSAGLGAGWPAADCREFARLITRFAGDVNQHAAELDC